MKKLFVLLAPLLFAQYSFAQLKELRVYDSSKVGACNLDLDNQLSVNCPASNFQVLKTLSVNKKPGSFQLDFQGKEKDLFVTFHPIELANGIIHLLGSTKNDASFSCNILLDQHEIIAGDFSIKGIDYELEIDGNRLYYYLSNASPFDPASEMSKQFNPDYNLLSSFSSLSDVYLLTYIWGKEARNCTYETGIGIDLNAPIFHGCYDWHSAIHGHYASNFAGVNTNDPSTFINPVNNQFTSSNVQGEINYVPSLWSGETEYGMPWLLSYSQYMDTTIYASTTNPLDPLLGVCYNQSKNFVMNNLNNYNTYYNSIDNGYRNYNWQLLNLYIYAEQTGDAATMQYVINKVNSYAPNVDWNNTGSSDFYSARSIALQLYTATGLTSGPHWDNLITAYDNSSTAIPYNVNTASSHRVGRIISYAHGYWLMYHHTCDTRYLDAFIDHYDAIFQLCKARRFNSNYFGTLGHWVPNFGVFGFRLMEAYPGPVELDIRLLLEGAYDSNSGNMSTTLNTVHQVLPGMTNNSSTGQPYNTAPWNYNGTEGQGWSDADYNSSDVDWILLSLRTDVTKSSEVLQIAGIVKDDRTVYWPEICKTKTLVDQDYYVVVEHRNHMAAMSPVPVAVANRSLTWDFSTQNSYAIGSTGQKEIGAGIWALVAGDGDQVADQTSYDVNGVDRVRWSQSNGFSKIYSTVDFNMDSDVTGGDKALWFSNNGLFSAVPK